MNLIKENFAQKNIKKNLCLEALAKDWLLYKKHQIKESTYYRYKYIIEKYILGYFKNVKVSYFEDYNFNILTDKLIFNLSVKTAKNTLLVLKSLLKYAEKKYNFNFKLDLISIPKYEADEIVVLSKKEKLKLESFCYSSNTFRDLGIIICLNTGMRIGEICALKWKDIDLQRKIFTINKSLQRVYKGKNKTTILIDKPKSHKSIRKIPISQKIYNILKELKAQNNFSGEEYFLTGQKNIYIEPRNYQYRFKTCLKKCKIKDYKFHILRHTFATECIEVGMDIKSLSEILGHSSVDITLDKYVHSSFNMKKKYLEKL